MPEQTSFETFKAHQQTAQELLVAAQEASEAIESAEMAFLTTVKIIREHRSRADTIETRIAAEVGRETTENDKLKYTNDLQRKSAISERLASDNEYRDAVRAALEVEAEQAVREIRIKRFTRDFRLTTLAFEAVSIGRRER